MNTLPPAPPQYPQAVPSVAIEPPLSGPLLNVLQDIVGYSHAEPGCRGLFSGLAAVNASLAVTPRGSALGRKLVNLKRSHHEYARMLNWVEAELAGHLQATLNRPTTSSTKRLFVFSDAQRRVLESAFLKIDPRSGAALPTGRAASRPFRGATFSTLRGVLQQSNPSRRRGVAGDQVSRPLFKARTAACVAHWSKVYKQL